MLFGYAVPPLPRITLPPFLATVEFLWLVRSGEKPTPLGERRRATPVLLDVHGRRVESDLFNCYARASEKHSCALSSGNFTSLGSTAIVFSSACASHRRTLRRNLRQWNIFRSVMRFESVVIAEPVGARFGAHFVHEHANYVLFFAAFYRPHPLLSKTVNFV